MIENLLAFLADNGPGNALGLLLLVLFVAVFVRRMFAIYRKERSDE